MILLELTGSPKQINWAVIICAERLKTWKEQSLELFKRLEPELLLEYGQRDGLNTVPTTW